MFEWLVDEILKIKTPKFHCVDAPLPPKKRQLVETSRLPVPRSYKQFVIRFGNATLYRQGNIYLVQVFAVPIDARSPDGEPLLHFGRTDRSLAYFNQSLLVGETESPVFEWRHQQGLRRTSNTFSDWLKSKCKAAKRSFTKKEWNAIEAGPAPFTDSERAIVDARRKFRWRVVGVAKNGDLRFEVFNGSKLVLPFLSIGVRGKNGEVDGGIWLPVSTILPGQAKIIEHDCYKQWVSPENVELFDEPDPGPEDREQYWEFRGGR